MSIEHPFVREEWKERECVGRKRARWEVPQEERRGEREKKRREPKSDCPQSKSGYSLILRS